MKPNKETREFFIEGFGLKIGKGKVTKTIGVSKDKDTGKEIVETKIILNIEINPDLDPRVSSGSKYSAEFSFNVKK
jgi:hypothetical protein